MSFVRQCIRSAETFGKGLYLSVVLTSVASASPVLTAAGSSGGYGLTMFANNFATTPIGGVPVGPLGMALLGASGPVMVSDAIGNVRVFATNADNQSATNFVPSASYGTLGALGLAQVGNYVFSTNQRTGAINRLNTDGTISISNFAFGIQNPTGIAYNSQDGMLYVTTVGAGIYKVDPTTGAKAHLSYTNNNSYDGILVSPNGTNLYAAQIGIPVEEVVGYDLLTGTSTFHSGFVGSDPDGIVLGYGSLANSMFVNYNDGTLWEIDLTNPSNATKLVTGGSRGDFTIADNCSILFTQTDSIWRLSAPAGGCFTVPEPNSFPLVTMALLVVSFGLSRRTKELS